MKYIGRLVWAVLEGQTEWGRNVRFWGAYILGFVVVFMLMVATAAFMEWQNRPRIINIPARISGPVVDSDTGRELRFVDEKDLFKD